jgi:hypothetical protein
VDFGLGTGAWTSFDLGRTLLHLKQAPKGKERKKMSMKFLPINTAWMHSEIWALWWPTELGYREILEQLLFIISFLAAGIFRAK